MLPANATPAEVVDAYFEAFAARDFDRMRGCLADQAFQHRSPIAHISDPDLYAAYMSRIGPVLESLERRRTFIDGDEVCTIVDFRIRISDLMVAPVVMWFRVAAGRIAAIETFYDATEYRRMIELD